MTQTNLSNPGQAPVHGDLVQITHDCGAIEIKRFNDIQKEALDEDGAIIFS